MELIQAVQDVVEGRVTEGFISVRNRINDRLYHDDEACFVSENDSFLCRVDSLKDEICTFYADQSLSFILEDLPSFIKTRMAYVWGESPRIWQRIA